MKSLEELAKAYQQLLREKFPDIIVRLDPDVSDIYAGGMFAAFCIPDSREEEYSEYLYGEFPGILQAKRVEFVNIILHRDSDTRKHYPSIWREICAARRPRNVSAPAMKKPIRRQSPRTRTKSVMAQ